ncbi:CHRD domain-containing protein [Vitiosangium sp. GDMCC 1.1324]|uniref:CHRD domain-containing protein n=1 Tax=Vitiosangium sp. (strain GDMCC 1.1324) TaxID=2138576 RepID=UPI000D39B732|nr:CHRD domain-containing protein [Vitiosangium sp. GDMCC 1.1324]PTL79823.1 CHRD domain-containing protein [Vitiosangium sp. GDMCC 1.1324]
MHTRNTKHWVVLTWVAAGLLGLAGCGNDTFVSTTELKGANEVPAVTTSASGTANATLDGDTLTVTGNYSGLSSALHEVSGSAAHVHQAATGENGPILFNLTVTPSAADSRNGTFNGSKNLNDTEKQAFKDGLLYVNVHTEANQSGEIRGQFSLVKAE